jgi:hypothetical protein
MPSTAPMRRAEVEAVAGVVVEAEVVVEVAAGPR